MFPKENEPREMGFNQNKRALDGDKTSVCQRMECWHEYATELPLLVTERNKAVRCPEGGRKE